jgi:rod shape-determining protein MreC
VGDRVVAAGIDGVYPRGIPIGTVTSATPAPGLFLRIELRPLVDFGLLEDVYVLTGQPVPESIIQGRPDATP